MSHRKRLYDTTLTEHLGHHRQMAFVIGPRQVGKTTACRGLSSAYLNWDSPSAADLARLNMSADLIKADRRILISRTPEVITQGRHTSCNVPWLLEFLARSD